MRTEPGVSTKSAYETKLFGVQAPEGGHKVVASSDMAALRSTVVASQLPMTLDSPRRMT